LFASGNWEPIRSPLTNEITKNSNLNKKNVFGPTSSLLAAKNMSGKPIEKHMIANSILVKNLKLLFIRSRNTATSIAPQAAPAMKEATISPIHENTYPRID
jgi:hypothetical protein